MTGPRRIQRHGGKSWRMPAGAIFVGRPTVWGNPYRVRQNVYGEWEVYYLGQLVGVNHTERAALERAVDLYAELPLPDVGDLRGHDLVCWCPLDKLCHADLLLELANVDHPPAGVPR